MVGCQDRGESRAKPQSSSHYTNLYILLWFVQVKRMINPSPIMSLMKDYTGIMGLLNQNGFSWDEICKIVALWQLMFSLYQGAILSHQAHLVEWFNIFSVFKQNLQKIIQFIDYYRINMILYSSSHVTQKHSVY